MHLNLTHSDFALLAIVVIGLHIFLYGGISKIMCTTYWLQKSDMLKQYMQIKECSVKFCPFLVYYFLQYT